MAPRASLNSEEQLSIYGIHELQVLEDVLRRSPSDQRDRMLGTIYSSVTRKIDWQPPDDRPIPPWLFLQSFYAAQRRHLEERMRHGEKRERKVR